MVGAVTTQTSQLMALAAASYPAQNVQTSQLAALTAGGGVATTQMSQLSVLVAAMGSVSDPHVRAWTFTLDGHDFYVLRLGNLETLVYDGFADEWYDWGSGSSLLWRAYTGCNWQAANALASSYGSNVIVGDDANGSLYFLDPTGFSDDDPNFGSASPNTFLREITGQVITNSFDYTPCFGVQILGAIGETTDPTLTTVDLLISDDQGHTFSQQETKTLANGAYRTRLEWWSLGAFCAPGRLFKVQDYGSLYRIDYMRMIEAPEDVEQ